MTSLSQVPQLITLDYCQENPQYNATLIMETGDCVEYSNRVSVAPTLVAVTTRAPS